MVEFINLDDREQETSIIPKSPNPITDIRLDTKAVDGIINEENTDYGVITIDKMVSIDVVEGEVEHICIKDDCDVSKYYGCTGESDGFQKSNLFSELTDEYQRAVARINLGIADEYALKWGNIKGNLSNQKDLYTFVTDSIAFSINKVIDDVNFKLAQWAYEIEIRFKNKADIFSPSFVGTPTTTLPLITDNTSRIASTEWVNARIAAASVDENVKVISLDPEYMCYGDPPTDVVVTWEYHKDVSEQSLNGVSLPPNIRQYTFGSTNTSMVITLKYKYEDISAAKIVTFGIKYPIYYGTSSDYTKLENTISNSFTIDAKAGEFLYVFIPNGDNTILAVSSIIGGFKLLGTQEIFNNTYYIFKSAHSGLGKTTVEILNRDNFNSESFDTTSIKELLDAKADKYNVYDKSTIDKMLNDLSTGETVLENYYTIAEVDSIIPDVSNKADKSEIPVKISQLTNDSNYLKEIPSNYVTDAKLQSKGYLTEEVEPLFTASAAKSISSADVTKWNNKVDRVVGMGLSEENFTQAEKIRLSSLNNYNDSTIVGQLGDLNTKIQNKADKSEIPDISGKADKTEIPVKTSALINDSGYLTTLPGGLITEDILQNKGYLTEFIETDPTVPAWAKELTKPKYTAEEIGADTAGAAANALREATNYTKEQINAITLGADPSYDTLRKVSDAIIVQNTSIKNINITLNGKADKSELFSKKYSDLIGTPTIPSITGLASEAWVRQQITNIPGTDLSSYALKTEIPDISTKVDKIVGKGLSTNDFTTAERTKLGSLMNYNDGPLRSRVEMLERGDRKFVNIPRSLYESTNPSTYFTNIDEAYDFIGDLAISQIITLEATASISLTAYNRASTHTIDSRGNEQIIVVVYFHYTTSEDLKMELIYTSDSAGASYTHTKEFITNSGTLVEGQIAVLSQKLSDLESIVNGLANNDSIILE